MNNKFLVVLLLNCVCNCKAMDDCHMNYQHSNTSNELFPCGYYYTFPGENPNIKKHYNLDKLLNRESDNTNKSENIIENKEINNNEQKDNILNLNKNVNNVKDIIIDNKNSINKTQ